MFSISWRLVVPPLIAILVLSGCGADGSDSNDDNGGNQGADSVPAGVLAPADLPFEPDDSSGPVGRPPILTQLSETCVGIEQAVLYDADWEVDGREYFDLEEWTVVSAVFTPPSADTDDDAAVKQLGQRHDRCVRGDTGTAKVEELDVDDAELAYVITDGSGAFNAARAYTDVDDGKLAQVSLMKLPEGEDPQAVLQELVQKLDD